MFKSVLKEGLEFKDLETLTNGHIHIDEFSATMGTDDNTVVVSFYVRDKQAAEDLSNWFEKGYDFIIDSETSPGEIKPNRYLVYVEFRRQTSTPYKIDQILEDLETLTEYDKGDWTMVYDNQKYPWSVEQYNRVVPITPVDYKRSQEGDLNEMRIAAGLDVKPIHEKTAEIKALQNAAGM